MVIQPLVRLTVLACNLCDCLLHCPALSQVRFFPETINPIIFPPSKFTTDAPVDLFAAEVLSAAQEDSEPDSFNRGPDPFSRDERHSSASFPLPCSRRLIPLPKSEA